MRESDADRAQRSFDEDRELAAFAEEFQPLKSMLGNHELRHASTAYHLRHALVSDRLLDAAPPVHHDDMAAWRDLHDAMGGKHWHRCSRLRDDPCRCAYVFCSPRRMPGGGAALADPAAEAALAEDEDADDAEAEDAGLAWRAEAASGTGSSRDGSRWTLRVTLLTLLEEPMLVGALPASLARMEGLRGLVLTNMGGVRGASHALDGPILSTVGAVAEIDDEEDWGDDEAQGEAGELDEDFEDGENQRLGTTQGASLLTQAHPTSAAIVHRSLALLTEDQLRQAAKAMGVGSAEALRRGLAPGSAPSAAAEAVLMKHDLPTEWLFPEASWIRENFTRPRRHDETAGVPSEGEAASLLDSAHIIASAAVEAARRPGSEVEKAGPWRVLSALMDGAGAATDGVAAPWFAGAWRWTPGKAVPAPMAFVVRATVARALHEGMTAGQARRAASIALEGLTLARTQTDVSTSADHVFGFDPLVRHPLPPALRELNATLRSFIGFQQGSRMCPPPGSMWHPSGGAVALTAAMAAASGEDPPEWCARPDWQSWRVTREGGGGGGGSGSSAERSLAGTGVFAASAPGYDPTRMRCRPLFEALSDFKGEPAWQCVALPQEGPQQVDPQTAVSEGWAIRFDVTEGPDAAPWWWWSRLEKFWIDGNFAYGRLPERMGELWPNMRTLDLYSNSLEGGIPASFGLMRKLHQVQLQHNRLSGRIPEKLFHPDTLPVLSVLRLQLNPDLEGCIHSEAYAGEKLPMLDAQVVGTKVLREGCTRSRPSV
ncbi:hypothetical protein FNF29_05399 [Cafeteria roenbergensis]|uniref:Uncharacterized protein n=1 Tax=Cafeteria roenbergensis TaxID=33653 RepID=A0A5A8CBD9_CAFRO|nr:hypothetical protein FNF29_05399 [Cafeteria roenbergensis]|eukprot:KAA0150158.1 hypothetical protein FNF29_05399 [Cafeteria roenbergensis]